MQKQLLLLFVLFQFLTPNIFSQESSDSLSNQIQEDTTVIIKFKPLYINDQLALFTDSQLLVLDKIISEFATSDSIEIRILTSNSESSKEGFDALTLDSARKLKVGNNFHQKGIFIGISPSLRYMRIQNSYAIMRILTNFETKYIVDNEFTPYFRTGQYYEGTFNGLMSLINNLRINKKPSRNNR